MRSTGILDELAIRKLSVAPAGRATQARSSGGARWNTDRKSRQRSPLDSKENFENVWGILNSLKAASTASGHPSASFTFARLKLKLIRLSLVSYLC